MTFDIRRFVPAKASEAELDDYSALRNAASAVDMPEDAPTRREVHVERLMTPLPHLGDCIWWAAHDGGRMVGLIQLAMPRDENAGLVHIDVWVHPDQRRRSIGTELLRAAQPEIAESGRVNLLGVFKDGTAGTYWSAAVGCHVAHRTVVQCLKVEEVRPGTWDVPVAAGYRLARWVGPAPEDLLAGYAAARPAIHDAPASLSSYRQPDWTPERIRQSEAELAAQGTEERVVVAIEEATGRVVGVTSMQFHPYRPEFGYQADTSVIGEHRGHGLGVAMKTEMMRWLGSERPGLEAVYTTTAATNRHMIDVNLAVGYRTLRTIVYVETTSDRLSELFSATAEQR